MPRVELIRIFVVCVLLGIHSSASATVLFDDTSTTIAGADNATGTNYIASAFTTSSATNTLSASLLLQQISTGTNTVSIYSNNTYIPNALVATLTTNGTPSSTSAGIVNFSATSLGLSAGTTYWLVLRSTGSVAWSYSGDSTLTAAWALSADSGSSWYSTGDSYPYVFSVSDTIPEPHILCTTSVIGLALLPRKHR